MGCPSFWGSESSFNLSPIQSICLPAHSRVTRRRIRLTPVSQNTCLHACRLSLPSSESVHFLPLFLSQAETVMSNHWSSDGSSCSRKRPRQVHPTIQHLVVLLSACSCSARRSRTSRSQAHGISGTGLGLYLCRELVEQHRGYIWFESSEGGGSAFFIRLPLSQDTSPPSEAESTPAPEGGQRTL